jgi:anti-sigma28 factor (negative regulator of flagellin synthesis)
MTHIDPVGPATSNRPAHTRGATPKPGLVPSAQATARPADQVELSTTARSLDRLTNDPDVRADLVERVRGEIAAGGYVTDAKLDEAIKALLDEIS